MTIDELMEKGNLDKQEVEQLVDDLEEVRKSGLANMFFPREVADAAADLDLYNLSDIIYDHKGALSVLRKELGKRKSAE